MFDFDKYFNQEIEIYLENVEYNLIKNESTDIANIEIDCKDIIDYEEKENKLCFHFSRVIKFSPEKLFSIKIVYGFNLKFLNKENIDFSINEIDWVKEIIENGAEYVNNVAGRTSLLISQITSSSGQPPLVTPPSFMLEERSDQ
ncbi:MAG: hypothetical protein PHS74_09785 [Lachnospiraceae bacterium]|nr:hypothetical protein [Lachnospiraceae bacterium]